MPVGDPFSDHHAASIPVGVWGKEAAGHSVSQPVWLAAFIAPFGHYSRPTPLILGAQVYSLPPSAGLLLMIGFATSFQLPPLLLSCLSAAFFTPLLSESGGDLGMNLVEHSFCAVQKQPLVVKFADVKSTWLLVGPICWGNEVKVVKLPSSSKVISLERRSIFSGRNRGPQRELIIFSSGL